MEKVLLKPTTRKAANRTKAVVLENEAPAARLPVKLSAVIFSFFENELYVLLVKNESQTAEPAWALPSQLLHDSEDLYETGADMIFQYTNQRNSSTELLEVNVGKFCPVGQVMSVTYFSCVRMEEGKTAFFRNFQAKWHRIARLGWLNFDEDNLINNARVHLQYNATLRPFCFDFLPEYFTIPQFQKVYETIFGVGFDRRNFSKKILSTGLLLDSGFKVDMVVTNKAKLYRLDQEKYRNEFCELSNFVHSQVRHFPFL